MDVDGGGWTVIQRRGFGPYGTSRQISFNRTWEDYENGFGNVSIDYWFGTFRIKKPFFLCCFNRNLRALLV